MTDQPAILAELFRLLPPVGQPFDPFDRERWFAALEACLEVAYPRRNAELVAIPAETPRAETPRIGPHLGKVRCDNCGEMIGFQGMGTHQAMHRRAEARAAKPQPTAVEPTSTVDAIVELASQTTCPDCGQMFSSAFAVRNHQSASHRAYDVHAPPMSRTPVDVEAARRRAAEAL